MADIITSKRGRDMLVDDLQYSYNQNKCNKDGTKIYWECKRQKCMAR